MNRALSTLAAAGLPHAPGVLRAALAGVRALVLDADGVLVARGVPLPGAGDALHALPAAGIPFRVATNMSASHRSTMAERWSGMGLPLEATTLVTAASVTAAFTAAHHSGRPLYVITRPDGLREFDGQRLLSHDEAADPACGAAAVVLGDGDVDLSWTNLDRAFRLVRNGAALLACHRNPWWNTPAGPTLDVGGFVAALEFATGARATLCGKPGPLMYRAAFAALATEIAARGEARLRLSEVAMVGDDPRQDLAGARRLGMRGILVLSGRVTAAEAAAALVRDPTARRLMATPDAVAGSIADVVAALT